LRTRVAAGFAAGAFGLSASMAVLSYEFTSQALVAGRERSALRLAYLDAGVVHAGLATERPDVSSVLSTLNTGSSRRALLHRGGRWYARAADAGLTDAVPRGLQDVVEDGKLGMQRVRTDSGPAVVVGVPLPSGTGFYVIDSMRELDQTLRTLALVLSLVAAGTTAAGAGLGWYLTRRVLRPLDTVTAAAREITAGDLTARLDPATEPDLERLTTSFNEMVDQLAARLERDRRFAADVSHELRSPLQTLSAATSVLDRHRPELGGRAATAVTLLSEEVARFQRLVTDLLELSRDDRPAQRTPFDVADLVREECQARGLPPEIVEVADGSGRTWSATGAGSPRSWATCSTTPTDTAAARSPYVSARQPTPSCWRSTTKARAYGRRTAPPSSTGSSAVEPPACGETLAAPGSVWRWWPGTPRRTAAGQR
jgi:signal transduction histidine kinase